VNRSKELAKNTIIILLGTICTKMIAFFLLPLYTGILTTEEYGTVDLLNILVLLLLPIITFQVEQAVFRYLLEERNNEDATKKVISSGIFSVVIQCLIFLLLFTIFYSFIQNKYKIYLVLNVITSIFSSLFLQISRGIGDNTKYSIGSFISAFATIILNIIFLVNLKLGIEGMLLGTMLGQIICILYLFIFLKLYKFISFKSYDWKIVKELWKYSIPLIPNSLSWWVFGSSDRVIVSYFLGLSMNGILSAASKFSAAYTVLYNVFDRSWIESISLHINDEDIENYFNKMFNEVLMIFCSLTLLIIAFMPYVYPLMINENYSYGYNLVPILMIAALFNVIQGLVVVIYAAKKDTKSIAKTSFVAAALNIIIHFSLLKFLGLFAAAVSTLGAYAIISLYRLFDVRKKYLNIRLNMKYIIPCLIILLFELVLYYLNIGVLNLLSIIISVLYFIILNKNKLEFIKKVIKKESK